MPASKEELIQKLYDCVVDMEDEEVVDIANEYLEAGYSAYDGIMDGLVAGMNKASDYLREEFTKTLSMLLTDAARSMIQEIDAGTPQDTARDHFNSRADIYIQEQAKQYAARMAAAGDPISSAALETMQQGLKQNIATRTDELLEKINRL